MALPTTLQLRSTLAAIATSTTNTRSTPQTTTTKPSAAKTPPFRTLATLKRDLHINSWKCGAETLKNTECKRAITQNNKDVIDAQLTSMTGLTCASPDFESAVHKLIVLVHCYQHKAGQSTERRLEAWRLAFSPGSADGSVPEVSVERLIKKALKPQSTECIIQGCKERIGGQKVQNCEKTVQGLIKQILYSDNAKLEFLLKVLEWNRTCTTHQSSRHFACVATWKESIMEVLSMLVPLGDQALASNAGPTTSPDADPALYWSKAYDSSPFNILARAKHYVNPKLIRDQISRPLLACDLCEGQVYAYEVKGNKGYVKIGYTTRPVTERHDEWSFDCNRQTLPLYPSPAQASAGISSTQEAAVAPTVLIPHARRVEALCHAELNHRRIRMYCGACLKPHIEWFEVSVIEVTAVIQKWSRWMATQPYELLQLRDRSEWTLKAGEVERTSRFKQFMRVIAVVPC
jgi:hypothetical protein